MGSGSYSYSWQVSDTGSGNEYGHRESRTGDSGQSTEGEYFVRLPDGRLQTVTYHVSPYSGFRAKVLYDHEASAPPQPPPSPFRRQPKPHKQQSLFNYKGHINYILICFIKKWGQWNYPRVNLEKFIPVFSQNTYSLIFCHMYY